jgi:hypothetical protein
VLCNGRGVAGGWWLSGVGSESVGKVRGVMNAIFQAEHKPLTRSKMWMIEGA